MPSNFPVVLPLETAWSRRVLCAAEIVDAVTLDPVTSDIMVSAQGLQRAPQLNRSGFYVWLEEGAAQPQRILVDASQTAYADAQSPPPAPPQKSVRIELVPTYGYTFPPGSTALRGTLRQSRFGTPRPVAGSVVLLQWSDETGWVDAPIVVTSDENGDFAASVRFAPKDSPQVTDGALNVRLRVKQGQASRVSDPFALPRGTVTQASTPFIWDDLHS